MLRPIQELMANDLVMTVYEQLPRGIQDRVAVAVESDAFRLRAKATFTDETGRKFQCELELQEIDGRMLAWRVPEVFIAHLCAVL